MPPPGRGRCLTEVARPSSRRRYQKIFGPATIGVRQTGSRGRQDRVESLLAQFVIALDLAAHAFAGGLAAKGALSIYAF